MEFGRGLLRSARRPEACSGEAGLGAEAVPQRQDVRGSGFSRELLPAGCGWKSSRLKPLPQERGRAATAAPALPGGSARVLPPWRCPRPAGPGRSPATAAAPEPLPARPGRRPRRARGPPTANGCEIGRASCRERVCQYVKLSVVAAELTKTPTNQQRKTTTST